jgi:hypothetical protein
MRRALVLTVALACSLPAQAQAQEYFGKFLDQLGGVFEPTAKPRPIFRVGQEFRFDDPNGLRWTTPAGTAVDGASIPQAFWSFIGGPFEGEYINASVIHDYYCDTKERTAHDTHRNFYYGMRAAGVPPWKANFMYWAVAAFGPDWKIVSRVTMSQSCKSNGQKSTCKMAPKVEKVLVTILPPDLSDPEVLALALAKANAVAKNLRTSDGQVLDTTATGVVLASPEGIEATSALHRAAFTEKDVYASADELGVLASPSLIADLDKVQPWASPKLPVAASSPFLTPASAQQLQGGAAFRLDADSKAGKEQLLKRFKVEALRSSSEVENHQGQ